MSKQPGRNDSCHCGSGKKYKNCCEGKDHSSIKSKGGMILLMIAIVAGLFIAGYALSGGGGHPDCPAGTTWSDAHQHCH
jgi:hypothetical protein